MSDQDHKHFNSVNEFLDYLDYTNKPDEKTTIDKEFISLRAKLDKIKELSNSYRENTYSTDSTISEINQLTDLTSRSSETTNLIDTIETTNIIDTNIIDTNNTNNVTKPTDTTFVVPSLPTINALPKSTTTSTVNVNNTFSLSPLLDKNTEISSSSSITDEDLLNMSKSIYEDLPTKLGLNKNKEECHMTCDSCGSNNANTIHLVFDSSDHEEDDEDGADKANKITFGLVYDSSDHEEYEECKQNDNFDSCNKFAIDFTEYFDKMSKSNLDESAIETKIDEQTEPDNKTGYVLSDYESLPKRFKSSHDVDISDKNIETNITEQDIENYKKIDFRNPGLETQEKDLYSTTIIDEKYPEARLFIEHLYDFLYNYSNINNFNKRYFDPKFMKSNSEFLDVITVGKRNYVLDINSCKSCYVVRNIKRKVLHDFSFKTYLMLVNLLIISMVFEDKFNDTIVYSSVILVALFMFMCLHLLVNLFKNSRPETFGNAFYEVHAYYTEYNSNILSLDYFDSSINAKIDLDLKGDYRILCDKAFIIKGYFLNDKNKKKEITLMVNKPTKYGGTNSVIEQCNFNPERLAINYSNINNLDVLLSLNSENSVNNLVVTNSLVSSKSKSKYGYRTYSFDLTINDYVYLPMFFRLISTSKC